MVEAEERLDADGNAVTSLDCRAARLALSRAFGQGYRSIAIALIHSYRIPDHERRLGEMAPETGFKQVSLSH